MPRCSSPSASNGSRSSCHPLDYALYAEIAAAYDAPLATGENLYSTEDVQNLGGWAAGLRARIAISSGSIRPAYGITLRQDRRHAGGQGWNRAHLFPTAATRCRSPSRRAFGLGGAESYPGVFGPFAAFGG